MLKNKIVSLAMVAALTSTSGCGYFLYPERVGQEPGKVDPTVLILDSLALLAGVLPGVVSLAVDFSTGAVWLPSGEKSSVEKHMENIEEALPKKEGAYLKIQMDPEAMSHDEIARAVSEELNRPISKEQITIYSLNN